MKAKAAMATVKKALMAMVPLLAMATEIRKQMPMAHLRMRATKKVTAKMLVDRPS